MGEVHRGEGEEGERAHLYTARASATRAFCPPDKLMPRSPISVRSPAGNT